MIANPILSGVWPGSNATSVVLKPRITVTFNSPGLIDPLTWNSGTFALYGPGDVVYDSGPGTILNSGIQSNPYVLIDDIVIRERIPGTYNLYTSGMPASSGILLSGYLGVSGSLVIGEFLPDVPLSPYTKYTLVLVGEDAMAWSNSSKVFPGVTSWTSHPTFSGTSPTCSGIVNVVSPYSRILHTSIWNSGTGYNDTYRIVITSGSQIGEPKFTWSKDSSPGSYASAGSGPHSLNEGLRFQLAGVFVSGQEYDLDVYIPQPLAISYSWSFETSNISGTNVPYEQNEPSLIIDLTPDGGTYPTTSDDVPLVVLRTWPDDLAYGVRNDLPMIMLEFNKPLLSGSLNVNKLNIQCTPILGMPNVSATGNITPTIVEYSGVFLKLWL